MTNEQLRACTKKQLADRARDLGVAGWHSMKKEELLVAVEKALQPKPQPQPKPAAKQAPAAKAGSTTTVASKPAPAPAKKPSLTKPTQQKSAARDTSSGMIGSSEELIERSKFDVGVPPKDLSAKMPKALPKGYGKDRIVTMVRDPYWLHCFWELTHQSIQRAEAALGQDWHGSKPILRLLDVSAHETTSTSEAVIRDIEIHGGCNNWYLEVPQPPKSYRVDIGYVSKRGQFFVLAKSNVVTTPRAGVSDVLDENWADFDEAQAERIFAMSSGFDASGSNAHSSLELRRLFEERLRRPMGAPLLPTGMPSSPAGGSGSGLMNFGSQPSTPAGAKGRKFWFQLDAELIVYGASEPNAKVTLQGEPVKLRPDGSFTMRFSLPDSRQIIPAVALSADGVEERTIVLAVERNTKHLEPMIHDSNEG